MNWTKYNTEGWQGRKDYITVNTRAIYVPNYSLRKIFDKVAYLDIYYDKDKKAILLRVNTDGTGLKLAKFKASAHMGTSLARVMPIGWYIYDEDKSTDTDKVFILSKEKAK